MRIDSREYYASLNKKFGQDIIVFSNLLDYFDHDSKVGDHSQFISFWNARFPDKATEGDLFNFSYELYNNLIMFYTGGVFELFKNKQAEWGAPEIVITKLDAPAENDINYLNDPQQIYRGLSEEEHKVRNYFQSWTTSLEQAKKFADDVYSDQPSGIVVQAKIPKENIIHYKNNDPEKEVIIEKNSIAHATKI